MSNDTQIIKADQRRQKFATLLRDMFQLDQPELDFGLYRIMHARKADITRFIDDDLPQIAREAFTDFAGSDKAQLEQELQEAREGARAAGYNPDKAPNVKKLQKQLEQGFDFAREEGEVYDALIEETFHRLMFADTDDVH